MIKRAVALCAALIACAALPGAASGHPMELGEVYVPWTDKVSAQQWLSAEPAASTTSAAAQAAPAGPGSSNMSLVGNSDKDGVTNSDLAFWGDFAYAGNYGGFRILDVRSDKPATVVDHRCNGPQNDVSVHEMGGKRFLFQSIDTPQSAEDCSSVNQTPVGYEGVRVFDVSNPTQPKFVDMIQTACGSHTHSIIPDGDQAYIYVASYPLSNLTPPGNPGVGDGFRPCAAPHKKITVIKVSAPGGEFRFERKEQPLSDDTTFNRGFQACHDIQFFMKRDIALASCAGDAQLWDISDPWNPTSNVEGEHTHIRSPSPSDQFEFIHSGVVSWNARAFAIMDETGGGVEPHCFGDASQNGFYYFYKLVDPGDPAPALKSRYSIPRNQASEICVSHNATVIPVKGRLLMSTAYYQGGVSVIDFTNLRKPREVAFSDIENETGKADEWSSYWYNGRIFSNSGLNRRGGTENRGVDVYRLTGSLGRETAKAERWSRSNPQTQEAWQAP